MWIYNPHFKKLDSRIVSDYFIGYVVNSKGYRFYYPNHVPKIVEARNGKFLDDYKLSRSGFPHKDEFKKIRNQTDQPIKDMEFIII